MNDKDGPEMMSDWFWDIVGQANRNRDRLTDLLSGMSREEIVRFNHEFKEAAVQLTDSPYTDHMIDVSEDGIQDIAEWVVSQGKAFYIEVVNNPETIPDRIEQGDSSTFTSVADNIFWDRFQQSIPLLEE